MNGHGHLTVGDLELLELMIANEEERINDTFECASDWIEKAEALDGLRGRLSLTRKWRYQPYAPGVVTETYPEYVRRMVKSLRLA